MVTGYCSKDKYEIGPLISSYRKIDYLLDQKPKCKGQNIKLLGGNIARYLYEIRVWKDNLKPDIKSSSLKA